MTNRWWIWLPLLGLGTWLTLFGDKSPAGDAPALSLPVRVLPASPRNVAAAPETLESLIPRDELIARAQDRDTASRTGGRDLFSTRNWNPPPVPAPVIQAAPVAPPLPFGFLGKKLEGGAWEVYLGRGEQTFIAREGQVLDGTYRVDKIDPPSLALTYLPLGQAQTLSIGDNR